MDSFWNTLLLLKQAVEDFRGEVVYCRFSESGRVVINSDDPAGEDARTCIVVFDDSSPVATADAAFRFKKNISVELLRQGRLHDEEVEFLKKYLPHCFTPLMAKRYNRTISIAHFAQTLDGKIATTNGDSQWIGNRDNLIHAHRMRALCDGILIGNRTLQKDKPRLTVRHVPGANPQRIVLGTSCRNYDSLFEGALEEVIVIGSENGIDPSSQQLDYMSLKKENGIVPPILILEKLYRQKKISSLYIEGGARTTSCFLTQNAVDLLQLHIAPVLFGSGKSGISLPAIQQVKEAVHFRNYQFHKIGSEIMFTGCLNDIDPYG